MVYLIFLGITFFIQLLASSWYTLVDSKKELGNSFKYKMLCCFIYVADILLCGAMVNAYTNIFFILLSSGILITFLGDISEGKLSKKNDALYPLLRSVSNIFFCAAVIYLWAEKFEIKAILSPISALVFAITVITYIVMLIKDKSLNPAKALLLIPVFTYAALALILGIACQKTGIPQMQTLSFLVITGSLFIAVSDIIRYGKSKDTKKLLRNNLYFFGLMLFVCSVASI